MQGFAQYKSADPELTVWHDVCMMSYTRKIKRLSETTGNGRYVFYDPVTGLEYCEYYIVDVDVDIDSNFDGKIDGEDEKPDENEVEIEESKGGFVMLNLDDDNTNGIPDNAQNEVDTVDHENDLTLICLTLKPFIPEPVSELTLKAVSGESKINIWESSNKVTKVTMPITWTINAADAFPTNLYVEGIERSDTERDVELQLSYQIEGTTNLLDTIKLTVVTPPTLTPDFNRDGVIDASDKAQVASSKPFRFWINDDNDHPSSEVSGDDAPDSYYHPDYREDSVYSLTIDGLRDLIDFFPVCIELDPILVDKNKYTYYLKNQNEGVTFVYTGITPESANSYLIDGTVAQSLKTAIGHRVTRNGMSLTDKRFLEMIDSSGKAVLLLEGRAQGTTEPLVLEVREKTSGNVVAKSEFQLSIFGVEQMFRHENLRTDGEGSVSRHSAPNWPDELTNGKNFIFVHGNNTDGDGSRGWNAEVFKCMWWSGSNYKYHAISWESDIEGGGANYHPHVARAFVDGERLKNYVHSSACAGDVVIAAQSLGNMVVGSAIEDFGMRHERYYLIDAAVPLSAYDAALPVHPNMIHDNWAGYNPGVWAANWHKLFPSSDDRSKLHWEGRFANVLTKAYNFYSSSDEIFETKAMNASTIAFFWSGVWENDFGQRHSWQKSEIFKGEKVALGMPLGSTDWAGWGFKPDINGIGRYYTELLAENAYLYNQPLLKSDPVFRNTPPEILADNDLSPLEIGEMLAKGIPALTQTAGKDEIEALITSSGNKNINLYTPGMCPNGTPHKDNEWHHNDMKNIPYVYKYELFKMLKEELQ